MPDYAACANTDCLKRHTCARFRMVWGPRQSVSIREGDGSDCPLHWDILDKDVPWNMNSVEASEAMSVDYNNRFIKIGRPGQAVKPIPTEEQPTSHDAFGDFCPGFDQSQRDPYLNKMLEEKIPFCEGPPCGKCNTCTRWKGYLPSDERSFNALRKLDDNYADMSKIAFVAFDMKSRQIVFLMCGNHYNLSKGDVYIIDGEKHWIKREAYMDPSVQCLNEVVWKFRAGLVSETEGYELLAV